MVIKSLSETLKICSRRDRANTLALFFVLSREELPATKLTRRWNAQSYASSIIVPVGYNYDRAGIVRGLVLGLRLSEKNRLGSVPQSSLALSALREYIALADAFKQYNELVQLSSDDLVAIARGEGAVIVEAINKLIKLLPIAPFDAEQIRMIYEKAHTVFTSA